MPKLPHPLLTKEFLLDQYVVAEKSANQIAQEVGVTHTTVTSYLRRFSLPVRVGAEACSRKYARTDVGAFRFIRDDAHAYWLGFLSADGYIFRRGRSSSLSITLATKDRAHLESFKAIIGVDNPIRDQIGPHPKSTIALHNAHLVTALSKYDVKPNKTARLTIPNALSRSLVPAFIRGYFDGDGTIMVRYRSQPNSSWVEPVCRFISGSKPFLREVADVLRAREIVTRKLSRNQNSNAFVLPLSSTRENIQRFYDYLYQGSTIQLERKRQRFEEYFGAAR